MVKRRTFLQSAAAAAAAGFTPSNSQVLKSVPKAESLLGKVKIPDVQTASVMIKYPAHLVRIVTDQGIIGLGEAYNRAGIVDLIHDIKHVVIGQDPLQVDYLFQRMIEAGIGHGSQTGTLTGAIAGIESALWNSAGRILNVPIYVLLGGKFRDRLLIYHDTGSPQTPDPAAWVAEAEQSLKYGFQAMKFDVDWESRGQSLAGKPHKYRGEIWNRGIAPLEMEQWVKILEAIRKRIGPRFPLGVDLYFNYNVPDSIRFISMVEHLNLWFIEDPTPPLNADALKRITEKSRTPICTGENLFTRETWRLFIEKQACDIIQPDPAEGRWFAGDEENCRLGRPILHDHVLPQHVHASRHNRVSARLRLDPVFRRPRVRQCRTAALAGHRSPGRAAVQEWVFRTAEPTRSWL